MYLLRGNNFRYRPKLDLRKFTYVNFNSLSRCSWNNIVWITFYLLTHENSGNSAVIVILSKQRFRCYNVQPFQSTHWPVCVCVCTRGYYDFRRFSLPNIHRPLSSLSPRPGIMAPFKSSFKRLDHLSRFLFFCIIPLPYSFGHFASLILDNK